MNTQLKNEIVGLADAYCFEKTERDDKVISFLYENGYALASQLMECGFSSKRALIQRLSLLRKSGLIYSKRVGEFQMLQSWLGRVAYRGTPKPAANLLRTKLYYLNPLVVEPNYKRQFLFKEEMIRHQLGLGLIRNDLARILRPELILSENKWISHFASKQKVVLDLIPDLIVTSGEIRLAVEYERTLKGKSTYLSRWYDYDRSEFSHVLYFAETVQIFEKLKAFAGLTHRVGIVDIQEPHFVYKPRSGFISLQDFFDARFV